MAKEGKKISDKLKEGVSAKEIEGFARKYAYESFLALAVIVATISSMFDFFSGPGWSLLFCGIATAVAIFFPHQIRGGLEKFYSYVDRKEQTTLIIVGLVRLVVALFLPFIIFGGIGLLAGTSYNRRNSGSSPRKRKEPPMNTEDKDHL